MREPQGSDAITDSNGMKCFEVLLVLMLAAVVTAWSPPLAAVNADQKAATGQRGSNMWNATATRQLAKIVRSGEWAEVHTLLRQGANPNVRDETGRPAIVAIASSAINLWEDDGGKTAALIERDRKERLSAIRALLQAGANPNAQDRSKMSALDWSLQLWDNHYDAEIAALLIECGARTHSELWIEDGTLWGKRVTSAEFVAHVRAQNRRRRP